MSATQVLNALCFPCTEDLEQKVQDLQRIKDDLTKEIGELHSLTYNFESLHLRVCELFQQQLFQNDC